MSSNSFLLKPSGFDCFVSSAPFMCILEPICQVINRGKDSLGLAWRLTVPQIYSEKTHLKILLHLAVTVTEPAGSVLGLLYKCYGCAAGCFVGLLIVEVGVSLTLLSSIETFFFLLGLCPV